MLIVKTLFPLPQRKVSTIPIFQQGLDDSNGNVYIDIISSENYDPSDIDIGDITKFINDPNRCQAVSEPNK